MRISTDGNQEYRAELYDRTAENLGESTRAGGIDAACRFTNGMLLALERAADHPDMTPELADLLSVGRVDVTVERRTSFSVDGVEKE